MEETALAGEDSTESLEEFHMVLSELLGDRSMDTIRELDKAWKMVDAAHDKEKRDKETIRNLKEEVSNLMKTAEQQTNLSMDQKLSDLLKLNEELTDERDQLLTTVGSLRDKLNKATATQQDMEDQRQSALQNISQLQQELQVQQNEISREMRLKEKLDKEVKQLHTDMETKMGDIKALNLQGQKAKEEQQRLEQQLKELKILNERSNKELEQMQVKNTKLNQECEHLSSVKEHLSLQNQQSANELKMREEEVTQMRQEIAKQTKTREAIQKKLHQMEDQKADIDNMIKAVQSTEKQENLVKLLEQDKKTLEHEIMREMEIFDWRKKVTEAECKLKQQENLLESVVSERNLYSKNLIEAQEEITEIKRKIKTMNNQVTRLRDEITGKELALAKDQQEHKRLEKDNESLKVIRERDTLGKQLLHRNDERALLCEKIRIQLSILSKGDFHYKQRMEDIRLLKLEIKRLQHKKSILDKTLPNTEDLRRELYHLQRELLRERMRSSVLEEQLKPINIHRWRRLEGSDPGKYELVQKVQSLQKRLIAKTQKLEEQELLLQEKEKLYIELKHILARQPGPEAAEQLQLCQWTVRERTKKLKVLIAELRLLDSKTNEYKSENQRLANELANIKKKYLRQKKLYSEQRTKTKVDQLELLPQLSNKPHFTGGGFRIDNPVRK
ncbi:hypothetical protein INR49_011398 [Caranx melampygus]|nr:hypothetical protein INR49_011398 [Caranx melampygus]